MFYLVWSDVLSWLTNLIHIFFISLSMILSISARNQIGQCAMLSELLTYFMYSVALNCLLGIDHLYHIKIIIFFWYKVPAKSTQLFTSSYSSTSELTLSRLWTGHAWADGYTRRLREVCATPSNPNLHLFLTLINHIFWSLKWKLGFWNIKMYVDDVFFFHICNGMYKFKPVIRGARDAFANWNLVLLKKRNIKQF